MHRVNMARSVLLSTLTATILLAVLTSAQNNTLGCFYYDGTPAPKLTPCLDTTGGAQSTCCAQGAICWSNGICQVNYPDFTEDYLRDGCTDKKWESPNCPPRQCSSNPSNAAGIRPCGGISISNRYCCAGDNAGVGDYGCCTDTGDAFTLAVPTVVTTIGVGPATAKVVPIADSTATSTPPESITGSISGQTMTPSSGVPTPTPQTTDTSNPPSQSSDMGTKIGIGVGVGVGALFFIAFLAMLWWYLQNRRKLAANQLLLAEYQAHTSQRGQRNHGYYSADMKALHVVDAQDAAATAPHEMVSESDAHELPAHSSRAWI